jgi:hypothetical protein
MSIENLGRLDKLAGEFCKSAQDVPSRGENTPPNAMRPAAPQPTNPQAELQLKAAENAIMALEKMNANVLTHEQRVRLSDLARKCMMFAEPTQ